MESSSLSAFGLTDSRSSHPDDNAMEHSNSNDSLLFEDNYDALLKEVLEDDHDPEDTFELAMADHGIDIDLDAATAELPDELRAALEDRSLADKYLANLRTFMSHQRSRSMSSIASAKGDYASPTQASFTLPTMVSDAHHPHLRDPLSKVLDSVSYQTRMINGVQSLWELEQKLDGLKIPELDLPTVSETVIKARLNDLYKIQDDLFIHLHGGPLVRNNHRPAISDKKKREIDALLDQVAKEIGLYEEFVKRGQHLNLEHILNESDSSDEFPDSETISSLGHFDSVSEISRASSIYSPNGSATSSSLRGFQQEMYSSSASSITGSLYSSDSVSDQPPISELLVQGEQRQLARKGGIGMIMSESFKWTPLAKISDHMYSKETRQTSGLVSVLSVSGVIAIGTTRSIVFVYDYSQNLKCVLGDVRRAVDLGTVTSLAISADHTTIACGHSQGHIVIWDIRKPQQPIRTIDPIEPNQRSTPTSSLATNPAAHQGSPKEGHVKGTSILHLGFVGIKKSELVSGDDQGMAFYHVLYKVVMVNAVDTTRILGRYQNLSVPTTSPSDQPAESSPSALPSSVPKTRRPSTVFALRPLPLGQMFHPAENFGLVALLTPYKMIIVGLKPTPQTQYKFLKPKASTPTTLQSLGGSAERSQPHEHVCGCLAWLPVTKHAAKDGAKDKQLGRDTPLVTDPMLAFAWNNHLYIVRVSTERTEHTHTSRLMNPLGRKSKHSTKLDFVKSGECVLDDAIVALEWVNRQILVLFTPNEEMLLFDPKLMVVTERINVRPKQLVYHDAFISSLRDLANPESKPAINDASLDVNHDAIVDLTNLPEHANAKSIEMAYYHSIKSYKGKLFLLGLDQMFVGTLLSWVDRILALVRSGDFLHAIRLATAFYNGKWVQTVIGLPENEAQRKQVVGERLMELLVASLNYVFSRRQSATADGTAPLSSPTPNPILPTIPDQLYADLAECCVDACLGMDDIDFLFGTAYDKFADHEKAGPFLQVLEKYIVSEQLCDLPPAVMKDLVRHYSQQGHLDGLERIIWHVRPQSLDIDQVVSVCQREGLYEAMMYVWNRSMDDFVSPLVEMLKVIRQVMKAIHNPATSTVELEKKKRMATQAETVFDYLRMVLRGYSFPDGALMTSTSRASEARSTVYSFLFSGRCVVWPRVGGNLILTVDDEQATEPTYPYLRLLLRFNTKRFLAALEQAFEDPWLNGGDDMLTSTFEEDVMQGKVISRQIIINTLLDVMTTPAPMATLTQTTSTSTNTPASVASPRLLPSASASTVQSGINGTASTTISSLTADSGFRAPLAASDDPLLELYIFIANNLHKYTTFILLPLTAKQKILTRLTNDPHDRSRDEREMAVQQLLTVYTPNNEEYMTLMYEEAHFWNVLEDIYLRDKKYGKLVETYLKDSRETMATSLGEINGSDDDEDVLAAKRSRVFDCVAWLLDSHSALTDLQRQDVKGVMLVRIAQFVDMDGQRTAHFVDKYFGDHHDIIQRLREDGDDEEDEQMADKRIFSYLRGLLEPDWVEEVDKPKKKKKSPSPDKVGLSGLDFSAALLPATPSMPSPALPVFPPLQRQALEALYIDLMCQFDPSGVYDYLNTKLDLSLYGQPSPPSGPATQAVPIPSLSTSTRASSSSLRLDHGQESHLRTLLASCEHYGVMDAVVCLMEMLGDTQGALGKMLEVGKEKLAMILAILAVNEESKDVSSRQGWTFEDQSCMSNGLIGLGGVLRVGTRLCEQSMTEQDDDIENHWFRLLDIYVEASMEISSALDVKKHPKMESYLPVGVQQHLVQTSKSFVQSILTSLLLSTSPQVSLPRLLLRLIDSQTKGETTFEDFRDIFLSMLDTYKYEGQLLALTNRLFDRDVFLGVQDMVRQRGKGWRPQVMMCVICRGPILDVSLLQPDIWPSPPSTSSSSSTDSSPELPSPATPMSSGLMLFQCGHVYHRQCLHLQQETPQCLVCSHQKAS
ncbi:hypothetical protein DM01DRAFT_1299341 [Hesseltinella vesiculosa]|uniref:RING-type domain-containing protein n=1 Tax=Hesseltinella vesiculosa TaxID=101127 RepID=A0A1X2GTS6_9FUNG|nr:hypothetical protein DM01DRAFT_1299341 [Hesseltinella vesiculosa]